MDSNPKIKKVVKKGSAEQEKTTTDTKWFVNLDKDMDTFVVGTTTFPRISQKVGGPIKEIEATLESYNTRKSFEASWSLESDSQNTDVNFQGATPAKIRLEATKEQKKEERRLFTNWLELPDIGGDKHTIICTKKNTLKKNREILQLEIETWRRLWFTIFWTDDSQPELINDVVKSIKNSFMKAKIDMVHVPAEKKLDYAHTTVAILRSPNMMEDFVKAMHGGNHPALQRKPFHIQVVMVKECAEIKRVDIKSSITPFAIDKFEMNEEQTKVIGIKITIPKIYNLLTEDLIEQVGKLREDFMFEQTIKSLKVKIEGEENPRIEAGAYPVERESLNTFNFKLIGPFEYISKAIGEMKKVDLDFVVEIYDTKFAGVNDGNKIVISTHETAVKAKSTEYIAKVLIHEIGHAVGLAPEKFNSWTHPDHYTGYGGTGPHCKLNAVNREGIYRWGGVGKMCVMYHQVHDQAGPEFCDNCMKYLKFTKLRNNDLRYGDIPNWKKPWEFSS